MSNETTDVRVLAERMVGDDEPDASEPVLLCECGCGREVPGGLIEYAHPEDYRYSERA